MGMELTPRWVGTYHGVPMVPDPIVEQEMARLRSQDNTLLCTMYLGSPKTIDNGDGTYTHTWSFNEPKA